MYHCVCFMCSPVSNDGVFYARTLRATAHNGAQRRITKCGNAINMLDGTIMFVY